MSVGSDLGITRVLQGEDVLTFEEAGRRFRGGRGSAAQALSAIQVNEARRMETPFGSESGSERDYRVSR